ncbi:MAG TPA: ATP-binding protein [Bacteroidota bacterium]|nr:ATP-binding protein [Bacteroidota bacterium]
MTPEKVPGDVRQDQAFFGREQELIRLLKNLTEGRHTLIVGRYGIGKSSLMREARLLLSGAAHRVEIAEGLPPVKKELMLTVSSPTPLGDCLRELAGWLYRNRDLTIESAGERDDWPALKKRFTQSGSHAMQSEILKGIARSRKKYILFVSNLDRLSLSGLRFFQSILSVTVVCGSALAVKDVESFSCFWSSFDRIALDPLPGPVASQLIVHLMSRYPVNVVDPAMCRKEILSSADGSPFHIKNLMHRAATQGRLGSAEIRAFRAVEEGPFFNMGPLYMIGAGVLTAVKFFSVGAEKREHYIYYSAIGFMLYLTFRVFRSFFVFRPRRKR